MLMPLGGYKGSGLAMMVEILCSVLSGGAMPSEVTGIRSRDTAARVSQVYIAIDVARFMPVEEFTARVEKLVTPHQDDCPGAGLRRGAGGGRSGVAHRGRAAPARHSPRGGQLGWSMQGRGAGEGGGAAISVTGYETPKLRSSNQLEFRGFVACHRNVKDRLRILMGL